MRITTSGMRVLSGRPARDFSYSAFTSATDLTFLPPMATTMSFSRNPQFSAFPSHASPET